MCLITLFQMEKLVQPFEKEKRAAFLSHKYAYTRIEHCNHFWKSWASKVSKKKDNGNLNFRFV